MRVILKDGLRGELRGDTIVLDDAREIALVPAHVVDFCNVVWEGNFHYDASLLNELDHIIMDSRFTFELRAKAIDLKCEGMGMRPDRRVSEEDYVIREVQVFAKIFDEDVLMYFPRLDPVELYRTFRLPKI